MTTSATRLLTRMSKLENISSERLDDEDLSRESAMAMSELVKYGFVVEETHNDSDGEFEYYSYELTPAGREAAVATWCY
jgi:hypothetical protein